MPLTFDIETVSVPSRGYLFFYGHSCFFHAKFQFVSVPSRGYLFFYHISSLIDLDSYKKFPSPLGVISFFTLRKNGLNCLELVSVPSRGYLFFYPLLLYRYNPVSSFRPLSGLSLFLRKRKQLHILLICFRPLSGLSLFLQSIRLF